MHVLVCNFFIHALGFDVNSERSAKIPLALDLHAASHLLDDVLADG